MFVMISQTKGIDADITARKRILKRMKMTYKVLGQNNPFGRQTAPRWKDLIAALREERYLVPAELDEESLKYNFRLKTPKSLFSARLQLPFRRKFIRIDRALREEALRGIPAELSIGTGLKMAEMYPLQLEDFAKMCEVYFNGPIISNALWENYLDESPF